jgi:hypothetical protein
MVGMIVEFEEREHKIVSLVQVLGGFKTKTEALRFIVREYGETAKLELK